MLQQWFKDAKFGIFVHWGLYSVKGVSESWCIFHDQIDYDDYMAQKEGFTAAKYDPEKWAALFKRAGAKYAVLTTKHHDGFALWETEQNDHNATGTPAGRDLVGPYCDALRKEDLKVGLYFSHLDWSHPDNAAINPNDEIPAKENFNRYANNPNGSDYERWNNFLKFHRAQLKELSEKYHPDLLWFDGDWEKTSEQWDMKGLREYLHTFNPEVVLNSRMHEYGDYATPEQGFPVANPKGDAWELCMTLNDSWGYFKGDDNHKPLDRVIKLFCEIVGRGGNLLLGVGPYADGTFQPEQEEWLEAFGRWITPVGEAIYGTVKGLDPRCYAMPSTFSKDHKTLYLFVFGNPGEVLVKGLKNEILRASVLTSGTELTVEKMLYVSWSKVPATLWITLPEEELTPPVTVLKLELDGEADIYFGESGAIEMND